MFPDTSVLLRGGRKQDPVTREWEFTECVFYLSYNFDDVSISIGIYDDSTRSYLLETEYVKSLDKAVEILKLVNADFPGKIKVKSLTSTFELFYRVAPHAVYVNTPISDTNHSCDQCGDYNVDTLNFLYVPALEGSKFKEGSVEIHWEYGCYGGTRIEGSYEDYKDSAIELLNRAKKLASKKSYRAKVQEAIAALKQ